MHAHVRVNLRRTQLGGELTHSLHYVERAKQIDLNAGMQIAGGDISTTVWRGMTTRAVRVCLTRVVCVERAVPPVPATRVLMQCSHNACVVLGESGEGPRRLLRDAERNHPV